MNWKIFLPNLSHKNQQLQNSGYFGVDRFMNLYPQPLNAAGTDPFPQAAVKPSAYPALPVHKNTGSKAAGVIPGRFAAA